MMQIGNNPSPKTLINQIPVELLASIFAIAASQWRDEAGEEHGWMPILSVCRFWYAVACATPELWSFTVVHTHLDWLRLCLVRSAQTPLHINFVELPTERMEEVVSLLSQPETSSRISILHVRHKGSFLPMLKLLRHSLPSLEELKIRPYVLLLFLQDETLPFGDYAGVYPKLHTLSLTRTSIPRDTAFYANLRSLSLRGSGQLVPRWHFTFPELYVALKAAVRLEVLSLQDFSVPPPTTEEETPGTQDIIEFPCLRSYRITGGILLLTRIHACFALRPTVAAWIQVRIDESPPLPTEESAILSVMPLPMRPLMEGGTTITISGDSTDFVIHVLKGTSAYAWAPSRDESTPVADGQATLVTTGWQWVEGGVMPDLYSFVTLCPSGRLTSLIFKKVEKTYPIRQWRTVFQAYPTLEEFTIQESTADPSNVFRALARRTSIPELAVEGQREEDSDTGTEDLCPSLRRMRMKVVAQTRDMMSSLYSSIEVSLSSRAEREGMSLLEELTLRLEVDAGARSLVSGLPLEEVDRQVAIEILLPLVSGTLDITVKTAAASRSSRYLY